MYIPYAFGKYIFCIQGWVRWFGVLMNTQSTTKQSSNSSHLWLKIRLWIYFPVFREAPVMIYQRYKPLPLWEHHALKMELPVNKLQRTQVQSLHMWSGIWWQDKHWWERTGNQLIAGTASSEVWRILTHIWRKALLRF